MFYLSSVSDAPNLIKKDEIVTQLNSMLCSLPGLQAIVFIIGPSSCSPVQSSQFCKVLGALPQERRRPPPKKNTECADVCKTGKKSRRAHQPMWEHALSAQSTSSKSMAPLLSSWASKSGGHSTEGSGRQRAPGEPPASSALTHYLAIFSSNDLTRKGNEDAAVVPSATMGPPCHARERGHRTFPTDNLRVHAAQPDEHNPNQSANCPMPVRLAILKQT